MFGFGLDQQKNISKKVNIREYEHALCCSMYKDLCAGAMLLYILQEPVLRSKYKLGRQVRFSQTSNYINVQTPTKTQHLANIQTYY